MKNLKLLFTALLLLYVTTTATALDFKVNRIGYNITDATNMTVEVTRKGTSTSYETYSGDVIIPEFVVYLGKTYRVTGIGEDAFRDCRDLTSVEIPNSVTSIGDYAFGYCSGLTSIEIPNTVTSIGVGAFAGCTGITSIEIPNSVTKIANSAFSSTGLKSVKIPDSVTSIGGSAFRHCDNLVNVEIPNSVTGFGEYTFANCTALTSIEIPNSVSRIESYAFYYSGLTNIEIPNSVRSIGQWAFFGCSGLTSITIPNSVTSIEGGAFSETAWYNNQPNGVVYAGKLLYEYKGTVPANTSIIVKDGTLGINRYAFSGCSGLTSIEIPNSIISIGEYAFKGCTGLTSITSHIPADKLFKPGDSAFSNVDKNNCTLYVPYGAKETYATTQGWKEFANIVELAPAELTITINQYGSATYCSPFALDFSNVEGLKAYSAIGYKPSTQTVTLARVMTTGAGQGIFIKGEPGEYIVPVIDDFDEYTLNLFVGTLEQTTVNSTDGEMSNYRFTIAEGDDAPKFYPFADNTTFSANRAYLQIPTAWLPATAQKSLNIRFDDGETTDIEELKGESGEVKTVYDLQGRVVENPTNGIYIVNGKKVIIK